MLVPSELSLNATATAEWTVGERDLASDLNTGEGTVFPPVFSTPRMIALMELASARLLRPLLRPGEISVGAGLEIAHTAPTAPGARVAAKARYVGRDGNLFVIKVTATDESGEIGRGTHRRAIVIAERVIEAAARRKIAT